MGLFKWLKAKFAKKTVEMDTIPWEDVLNLAAENGKVPIYGLGDPNVYQWASGIDYQVSFHGKRLVSAQRVSFKLKEWDDSKSGELLLTGSPGGKEVKEILANPVGFLKIESADEFGNREIGFEGIVEFKYGSWTVSIDDIVTETLLTFREIDNMENQLAVEEVKPMAKKKKKGGKGC